MSFQEYANDIIGYSSLSLISQSHQMAMNPKASHKESLQDTIDRLLVQSISFLKGFLEPYMMESHKKWSSSHCFS